MLRTRWAIRLVLVLISALPGCGGGFVVRDPPSNEIMFIRNSTDLASRRDTKNFIPHPLPTLPARSGPSLVPEPVKPAEVPGVSALKGPQPFAAGDVTPVDVNTPPFDSSAKLDFFEGTQGYNCTAEFVGSTRDVLMTAAHCVFSNSTNTWDSGWRAYSKFINETYSGEYIWQCVAIYSGWAKGGYPMDYAFIKLGGAGPSSLGLRGATLPAAFKSIGYPSNYYSGEQLVAVDGTLGETGGGIAQMLSNPMGHGASGGAWLDGAVAIGLNSFKYVNDSNSMWGPQFDAQTIALYDFVRQGCTASQALASGSSLSRVDAPMATAVVDAAPDESCTCPGSKLLTLSNLTKNRYLTKLRTISFGSSGNDVSSETVMTEILPLERRPLSCSVVKDAKGACQTKISTEIVTLNRIRVLPEGSLISKIQSTSPAYCRQMCAEGAPTGYCLPLGASATAIVKSLATFASKTIDTGSQSAEASVPDIIKTFGGDPGKIGNPCARSSIYRKEDAISNDGVKCEITTASIGNSPLKISLATPTKTRATRVNSTGANFSTSVFSEVETAPFLRFLGVPNQDELTGDYGGTVVSVETEQKKTVITTENGCLSGEE